MGQRLKFARCRAGYSSATKAADSLGISASTYRAHENGQNDFSAQEAARYARKFGILPAWLYFGDGKQRKEADSKEADLAGAINAAADGIVEIEAQGKNGTASQLDFEIQPDTHGLSFSAENTKDRWRLPDRLFADMNADPANIVAFQVQGDAMKPTLVDGDIAFIDTAHRVASPDGLYALADDFGGVSIKRLTLTSPTGSDQVTYDVSFDNPEHKSQRRTAEEIQIIGRYLRRFTR